MEDTALETTAAAAYEPRRILANATAADNLAEAETGSVISVMR